MQSLTIPAGYQRVMPYLMLKNAENFFGFMQTVFDATEKMRELREDGSVLHCELQVDESTFMYSGVTDDWGAQTGGFYIYVPDADATYTKALEAGATSVMEPTDQTYGRSGGVTDPFGNTWWVVSAPQDAN